MRGTLPPSCVCKSRHRKKAASWMIRFDGQIGAEALSLFAHPFQAATDLPPG
jgi:hypothetical protein